MDYTQLIDDYLAGPQKLRAAVAGMTAEQLDARPIPGKWSSKQVICHIASRSSAFSATITGGLVVFSTMARKLSSNARCGSQSPG